MYMFPECSDQVKVNRIVLHLEQQIYEMEIKTNDAATLKE